MTLPCPGSHSLTLVLDPHLGDNKTGKSLYTGVMKIEAMYLGTWFQRTSLHLREIERFVKHRQGIPGLDNKRLEELWEVLSPHEVTYHEGDFDYLAIRCGEATVSITEDGVILIRWPLKDVRATRERLEKFYSQRLGPVLNYLFSLGAPLPHALRDVKEAYPILLAGSDLTTADVELIFQEIEDAIHSRVASDALEIFRGEVIDLFNLRGGDLRAELHEDLFRHLIFAREFEEQLASYLFLHRQMWETIARARSSKTMRYRDFPAVRYQLLQYLQILQFVTARLAQMKDILMGRQAVIASLPFDESVLKLDRFEHLETDQKYVSHLWEMTTNYVEDTLGLLESLFQENTQRELNTLKFVTLITALTGFFGMNIAFPWEERWAYTFPSSFAVVLLIAVIALSFYHLVRALLYNRRFAISTPKVSKHK